MKTLNVIRTKYDVNHKRGAWTLHDHLQSLIDGVVAGRGWCNIPECMDDMSPLDIMEEIREDMEKIVDWTMIN